jgi:hypothetical protein
MGKVAVKYARPIYVFLLSSSTVVQLRSYTVAAVKLIAATKWAIMRLNVRKIRRIPPVVSVVRDHSYGRKTWLTLGHSLTFRRKNN